MQLEDYFDFQAAVKQVRGVAATSLSTCEACKR